MRSIEPDRKNVKNIGSVLFPKIRRQLLTHFFLSVGQRHYFREITRIVNASPGQVQRELQALAEVGILATEMVGRQRYYWADPQCMIYSELKAIVIKTFGVVDSITAALAGIAPDISAAFIYGSIASGSATGKSDIDLMVIGNTSFRSLAKALSETEDQLARPINPTLFTPDEFGRKVIAQNNFLINVLASEKLFIVGTGDDLTRLAE